jgi:prophage regulatory protein
MAELLSPSARPARAAQILGMGESTFWRYAQRPDFPKPRRLGPRITVFDVDELLTWRDAQAGARNIAGKVI